MLADHVESKFLQHLQIVRHGFRIRRRVQTIGPESLIEGSELEDKLSIEKMASHSVHFALGNGAEARVALDFVITQLNGNIVQVGRFRPPQFRRFNRKGEFLIGCARVRGKFLSILVPDCDVDG